MEVATCTSFAPRCLRDMPLLTELPRCPSVPICYSAVALLTELFPAPHSDWKQPGAVFRVMEGVASHPERGRLHVHPGHTEELAVVPSGRLAEGPRRVSGETTAPPRTMGLVP